MLKYGCWILLAPLLSGCVSIGGELPKTLGETTSSYGYVPLDPLPIQTVTYAGSCKQHNPNSMDETGLFDAFIPLPEALPDIAVRFAVASLDANGQLQFGPAKVTSKGGAYRAVLDYINADSVTLNFLVRKQVRDKLGKERWFPVSKPADEELGERVVAFEARILPNQRGHLIDGAPVLPDYLSKIADGYTPFSVDGDVPAGLAGWERVAFPIYVGVGLRLTADIRALEGNVALSGLSAIGAQADAKRLTGTMTLQSLGINGLPMTTALALPSKLDQTTVEQSILAIGTGRAIIYTNDAKNKVSLDARVVGLYSPVGSDPRLINAVYSELSTIRVPWPRPCIEKKKVGAS